MYTLYGKLIMALGLSISNQKRNPGDIIFGKRGQKHTFPPPVVEATETPLNRTTDSSFDEKTDFTIGVVFSQNGGSTTHPTYPVGSMFSMYYVDGSGNKNGFFLQHNPYMSPTIFTLTMGKGDSNALYGVIEDPYSHRFAGQRIHGGQVSNAKTALFFTADQSSGNIIAYTLDTDSYKESITSNTYTNWGTLGANTKICLGASYAGGTFPDTVYNRIHKHMVIHKVGLWYSVLSKENITAMCNLPSTASSGDRKTDGLFFRDVGWAKAGVTQPNHEWDLTDVSNCTFGSSGDYITGVNDTGSTGGKHLSGGVGCAYGTIPNHNFA